MHGNVAQWCIDQYQTDWYKQFAGKTATVAEAINWPKTHYSRVIRGGSWNSEADDCRSASRISSSDKLNLFDYQIPKSAHWLTNGDWIGFRVVAPVNAPPESERGKWWDADDAETLKTIQRDREKHEIVGPGPATEPAK